MGWTPDAQTVFVDHLCDNNSDNDGIWVLRCAPDRHGAWHDAPCTRNNSHGPVYNYVQSGPGDYNIANGYQSGGCGPGFFHGGFAQDCLDHDVCHFDHLNSDGSFRSDVACGDEFEAAIGDFAYVNSSRFIYCRLSDSRGLGGPSVLAANGKSDPPAEPLIEYVLSLILP